MLRNYFASLRATYFLRLHTRFHKLITLCIWSWAWYLTVLFFPFTLECKTLRLSKWFRLTVITRSWHLLTFFRYYINSLRVSYFLRISSCFCYWVFFRVITRTWNIILFWLMFTSNHKSFAITKCIRWITIITWTRLL